MTREAAFGGQAAADGFAVVALAVVEDDLAAVAFGRPALHRRRVGRHDDDARDVEELAGERDRLRVVAGREGDDAAAAFVGREARQGVVGAAELEGARALQVLALEEHLGAGARVHGARRDDRRAMRGAGDLARGALDVGERRQVMMADGEWTANEEPMLTSGFLTVTRGGAVR